MSFGKIDKCTLRSIAILLHMPFKKTDTEAVLVNGIKAALALDSEKKSPVFDEMMRNKKEKLLDTAKELGISVPNKFTKVQIAHLLYPYVLKEMNEKYADDAYVDFV